MSEQIDVCRYLIRMRMLIKVIGSGLNDLAQMQRNVKPYQL